MLERAIGEWLEAIEALVQLGCIASFVAGLGVGLVVGWWLL